MNKLTLKLAAVALTAGSLLTGIAAADGAEFGDELLSIQHEFDQASFSGLTGNERKEAFATLVEHAAAFSARYPDRPEAVAWNGIVLSTYAGEVSAMSAMRYAKAARDALHRAESMAPEALDGGLYASLGALYSKVPGGMMGFGDDERAADYFVKALAVDPENIDSNFFYGEFLLDQEDYTSAARVLRRALAAPAVASRPLFDTGRRAEIQALLDSAERQRS
jgi:tetratricopeptide (TPR) repeat protein